MADIFLKSGETATGITFASNFYGRGGAGTETAGVTTAAIGSTFDQNVETVTLGGATGDFTYQQQGNQLLVFAGGTLFATVTIQDDANGTQLNFTNGTVTAKLDGTVLELNDAPVPSGAPDEVDIPGVTPVTTGQTFTLTENADQLTGQPNGLVGSKGTVSNAGDDLILAGTSVNGGVATNNLGSGDNVNGGEGTDTLRILGESTNDINLLPSLTAVEIIEAQNITTGDDLQINLTNSTGYDQLWAINTPAGTGDETIFNDIREDGTTIGARDFLGGSVRANFAAGGLASGVLGLAVENSDVFFEIDAAGQVIETVNVAVTAGPSSVNGGVSNLTLGLDSGDQIGTDLNIAGDGDLTIREDDNELEILTQVNVASTGALDIDLGDNDQDVEFNGGSGDTTLVLGNGDNTITTGDGDDNVIVGFGDNTIETNGGSDVVDITSGGDQTVDLGAGDDTLVAGSQLTIDDLLDGGEGTDTLSVDVYNADFVSADVDFDAQIAGFEVLDLTGFVSEGDDLVVDLDNLDGISNVIIDADLEAGTAVAETQALAILTGTGIYGGAIDIEGVNIELPANLTNEQVAAYIVDNFESDIIAAYNANHPGEVLTNLVVSSDYNLAPDHIEFQFAQASGDVPAVVYTPDTGTISSGATFGATATTVAGTTEVAETQTLQVTGAPTSTGFVTLNVAGTNVQTTLTAGQTVGQAAQTIADAITAAGLAAVASVSVAADTVTINYTAGAGDVAQVTFTDTGTTNATAAAATTQAYVTPVAETQTVAVTGGTDSNGGFLTITVGGDSHVIQLDPNLTIDEVGVYIASQQAAIIGDIPAIGAIGYNTLTDTLTFQYTTAAGDAPDVSLVNVAGNFPDVTDHVDTADGTDGFSSGSLLIDNIASGGTVTLSSENDGLVTVAPSTNGTNESLNVVIAAGYTAGIGEYLFDGIETLNFTTQGTTQELINVDGSDAETITVAGSVGIDFTDGFTRSFDNLTSFNASGITGSASATAKGVRVSTNTTEDASLTGGAGNDVIIAGSGDDTVIGGAGNDSLAGRDGIDTLTGGAGRDTFLYGAVSHSQGVTVDQITDFDASTTAGDFLSFNAAQLGITSVTYSGTANGYGAVLTSLTGLGGTVAQAVFDTSTSTLYIDVDASGTLDDSDMAIDITLTNGPLVQANFTTF